MDPIVTRLQRFASRQNRAFTRDQATACGVSRGQLATLDAKGVIALVLPRVFIIGRPSVDAQELLTCAKLHSPKSLIGAGTTLQLHRCMPADPHRVDLWIPEQRGGRLDCEVPAIDGRRASVYRRSWFDAERPPSEWVGGKQSTTVARAFVDLAAGRPRDVVMQAWAQGEFRCVMDTEALRAEADLPRKGTTLISELLRDRFPITTTEDDIRSPGELALLRLILERNLPRPLTNRRIVLSSGREIYPDFWWVAYRLLLELDPPHHDVLPRDREDKLRAQEATADGFTVLQFASESVEHDPIGHLDRLESTLTRLAPTA